MSAGRGRPYPRALARAQRALAGLHARMYRLSGGRLVGRIAGSPILVLVTTGRKTGTERHTPLLYLPDGEDLVIVASNGGTASHPAWYLNLRSEPRAGVTLGGQTMPVVASEATGDDKQGLWERLVRMYPGYAGYQRKTDREIPVIRLHPDR
ncbi:nitroreductase family deazaflavin-dependent oxidoreductase [Rubrobacter aplysinae]|uniref:nitroreductase family deazaflavin-dependent oxidoreductase n=1 Tax=Rubrobacter aplysinae TaxID=909625 RepID=UPI001910DB62|nr:nitroreductase family deazaflavin-dependent oxidoreductase [Rubrobacter aplysinae]